MRERLKWLTRERARIGAYLLAVIASASVAAWFATRFGKSTEPSLPLPLSGGGVTLSAVEQAADGPSVQADSGDWLLETSGLTLVVGSDADGVDRQLAHGAILDAVPGALEKDALFGIWPIAISAGKPIELRMLRVEPVVEGERPALRIAQSSRDNLLRLSTFIRLEPGRPYAEIVTRAENRGSAPIRALSLGDRVQWPGAPTYAPRVGFVDRPMYVRVSFIARQASELSYALAFTDGADVDFRFDRIGPTEQIATQRAADLAPGATVEHRRALIVATGGLEAVAEAAWKFEGKPVGRVRGTLSPTPPWATLQAEHADGKPMLTVRAAADGSFDLPLPSGPYELRLIAPGGEDRAGIRIEPGKEVVANLVPPEPGTLRFTVVDERRKPIGARWIVRGVPPTKTPFFGPVERASGAGSAGYTIDGTGRIELPAGRYLWTLSHGIEYALFEREVTITREHGQTLRAVLPRRVETPGWIACDFHVHAEPSPDSGVTLEDRVRSLIAEGVEFAVATDHNHVSDYRPSITGLGLSERLSSAVGVEMTTVRWGHFNAYPYDPALPPPPTTDVDPIDIFAFVRERAPKALVQINHPRMGGLGYFNQSQFDPATGSAKAKGFSPDFDVIEVMNGFDLAQTEVSERNLLEWFALLNAGKRYTAVGNSDSHHLGSEWVGYPRTYVRVANDEPAAVTPEQITEALKAGRAIVTNGPYIVAKLNGREPGELATAVDGMLSLELVVRAPSWIDVTSAELWLDGKQIATERARGAANAAIRLGWRTAITVERDGWLVVVVRGERSLERVLPNVAAKPFAFTNPIWIDADGDGNFAPPVDAGADAAAPDGGGDASADAPPASTDAALDAARD